MIEIRIRGACFKNAVKLKRLKRIDRHICNLFSNSPNGTASNSLVMPIDYSSVLQHQCLVHTHQEVHCAKNEDDGSEVRIYRIIKQQPFMFYNTLWLIYRSQVPAIFGYSLILGSLFANTKVLIVDLSLIYFKTWDPHYKFKSMILQLALVNGVAFVFIKLRRSSLDKILFWLQIVVITLLLGLLYFTDSSLVCNRLLKNLSVSAQ